MFYSQSVLSKKGTLEAIKIAAYFFKRLKKPQVQATDISSSVDKILEDEKTLVTCRVLGYLLLGIVRIYSKKVEYLLYDCQEVLLGITNFVVHTREDLSRETQRAPYFSITLPETYDLDAFDVDVLDDAFDDNVLPIEEITLKESTVENAGTKQHALDMCLYEDIAGSYNPCSAMYTPFEDILSSYGIDVNLRKLLNIDGLTTTMEMIQELRFSQREHMDRIVVSPVEEEPQNVRKTQNEVCQDITVSVKDPEILSSEQGMNVEASSEIVQHSGENDVNLVRPSEAELQLYDHVNPHDEDPQVDQDQIMASEPEQLRNEICQVNSQDVSPCILQPEIEKLRVYTRSRGQSLKRSVLCELEEPQEPVDSFDEENREGREQILTEIPDSGESHNNGTREDNSRSEKLSTPNIKIPDASDVDLTTPRFVGIATPATKERARNSRKRKCVIDEATYLPNRVIKAMIHDATDLVSKRRKVAYTTLDVWRAARSFPHHIFDPLLTGISPELRSLFHGKKLKMPKFSSKTMATPEKLDMVNVSNSGISEPIGIFPETPVRCSADISEQIILAPETPVQQSIITRPFDVPMSPGTPNCNSVRPFSFESPRLESSPIVDQQPDLINLMDEVVSLYPEDSSEWDGWSNRTRAVANYFRGAFIKRKERENEETLNLSLVVEGKSKKESARLFYEVLVLSSKGFVNVKQDYSYGDVLVAKLEKLDRSYGVEQIR